MEYKQLGWPGLKASALSLGTGTFGGTGKHLRFWGNAGVEEAVRLTDMCRKAGADLFDSKGDDRWTAFTVLLDAVLSDPTMVEGFNNLPTIPN